MCAISYSLEGLHSLSNVSLDSISMSPREAILETYPRLFQAILHVCQRRTTYISSETLVHLRNDSRSVSSMGDLAAYIIMWKYTKACNIK